MKQNEPSTRTDPTGPFSLTAPRWWFFIAFVAKKEGDDYRGKATRDEWKGTYKTPRVLTTSEDQGQYQVVLGCHHFDRWGSERLITMGNLSFKSNYYSCFFRFGYISCFFRNFSFFCCNIKQIIKIWRKYE
jgi:hypothetical protein